MGVLDPDVVLVRSPGVNGSAAASESEESAIVYCSFKSAGQLAVPPQLRAEVEGPAIAINE